MPSTPEGGRKCMGGAAALPEKPKKGRSDKQKIIDVDCQIDRSTVEKKMHERMTAGEP